jgi:hypothetical protein
MYAGPTHFVEDGFDLSHTLPDLFDMFPENAFDFPEQGFELAWVVFASSL